MKGFRKQRLWPVYRGTALFAALIAPGQGEQPVVLAPLTVTAGRPRGDAEVPPGNSLWIDAAALAALPVGKATYHDLFAAVAGAYGGNPSVGTFSLRGLNQDSLF